jgi:hypothetical protein
MKSIITLLAIAGTLTLALAGTASAHSGTSCPYYGQTVSPSHGTTGEFSNLRVYGTMNCASARYVMNKLRVQYRRYGRIRGRFSDGYVTWNGYHASGYGWHFYENTSSTSFSFNGSTSHWDY